MVTSLLALAAVSFSSTPARQLPNNAGSEVQMQSLPTQMVMTTPQAFVRAERMLKTPTLDGKIGKDDWDLLFDKRQTMVDSAPALAPAVLPTGATTAAAAPTTLPPTQPSTTPTSPTQAPSTPPVNPAPVNPAPGPGPLTGTPIRRTPNSNPNAKPPQTAPPTPPPAPVAVTAPAPAPVRMMAAPQGVQAAYMNWEPGKIYLAAIVPVGMDLVVSVDGKADGFLVGKDNLELRVSIGAVNTLRARVLDATNPAGPVWSDAPGFVTASQVVSSTSGGMTTIEISLVDPGYGILPANLGDKFALRFDTTANNSPNSEPFLPRVTTPVKLIDQWTEGLPANFKINVPAKGRGAFPDDVTTVRWELSGTPGMRVDRIHVEGEGWLNEYVNSLGVPKPEFDNRGNSTVEYTTKVVKTAPVGYGVLKGVITGDGWGPAIAEVSFRVPPPLDLSIPAKQLKAADKAQPLKASVEIRSNSDKKIEGHLQILPPAGWTVKSGADRNFYIYNRKGSVLCGFELTVPGGVHGSFPVTMRVAALGKLTDQTFWVTIL